LNLSSLSNCFTTSANLKETFSMVSFWISPTHYEPRLMKLRKVPHCN
jgi:hypothetical protein